VVPVDALRLAAGQIALSGTTDATARQLLDAFSAATIFSPAPARPGVVVLDFDGTNVVPVFSSRELLDEFTPGDWFSTTGLDLLDLLPAGVRLALDPNGPHPLLIDPAATKLEYAITVRPGR
jgi:hypothetical protein